MTIATQTSRNDYSANGVLTAFAYTFKVFDASHIKVYDAGGLKTLNTDYTVSNVGIDGGGNVTFTYTPANGHLVALIRSAPYTQLTDYVEGDPFPAETHEGALDRGVMLSQQLLEKLNRAAVLPDSSPLTSITLPEPVVGGELIRWKTDKSGLEIVGSGTLSPGVLNPIVAQGDLVQGGAGAIPERLAVGSLGSILRVSVGGKWEAGTLPLALTNKTGGSVSAGDVVALDTANDSAVALGDTVSSFKRFTVALQSIANNASGLFAAPDSILSGVAAQGAIARGEYVRKSATSKKIETTGVTHGDTTRVPNDAVGLALMAAAAGVVTVLWWGYPAAPIVSGAGAPGADFLEFTGIGTPATPASGSGRLFASSAPSGLRFPAWLDAGGQVTDVSRVLHRAVGNPIKDIVNSNAETSCYASAPTIKGGTLGTNRILRVMVWMDYLNNAGGNHAFTLRFKYGGTTFATISQNAGALIPPSATRYGFLVTAWLTAAGVTNVQVGSAASDILGLPDAGNVGVTGGNYTANATTRPPHSFHNAVPVDSTADQTLDVTGQHDAASANQSARPYAILTEVL